MENAESTKKLLSIMPLCIGVQNVLIAIRDELSQKLSYYKTFGASDVPNILPLHKLNEIKSIIIETRENLLLFDEQFDKNQLPQKIKEIYISIFIQIENKEIIRQNGSIRIGSISYLWQKDLQKVIKTWDSLERRAKVGYSKEAYYHVKNYLQLISLISKLEKVVLIN